MLFCHLSPISVFSAFIRNKEKEILFCVENNEEFLCLTFFDEDISYAWIIVLFGLPVLKFHLITIIMIHSISNLQCFKNGFLVKLI